MKKSVFILIYVVGLVFTSFSQTANAPEPTLESPYNTMYVHLYYLQPETYYPEVAAVTLFRSKDSLTLINRSIKLKQIFDGNGLFVRLNQLPQEIDYIDSTTQKPYYTPFPEELPDVYLEKFGDKWIFSKETVDVIPFLHKKTYPYGTDRLLTLLPKMGQNRFLGLAMWQWVTLLILLLLSWLVYKTLSWILHVLEKRILKSYITLEILDDRKLLKVAQALSLLFLFWMIRILIPVLQLPISSAEILILILKIVLTIVAVVFAVRVVSLIMDYILHFAKGTEQKMDEQVIPIINRSLKVVFVVIGIFHILRLFDVNIAALIAGISIGGLALALAAQDTVKNLIGSAMIFFDRPFQIGDYINGGGVEGTVVEVGFRTTRLQILDSSIIAVPNGTIANASITNYGVRTMRVMDTALGLTYNTPPDLIEKFIEGLKQIILLHPVTKKEGYYVHLKTMEASSLNVMFRAFLDVRSFAEEAKAKEEIYFGILRLAELLGVNFAFPSSTVYLEQTTPEKADNPLSPDEKIQQFLADFKKRNTPEEDFLD